MIEEQSGWSGFAIRALDSLGKAAPWVVIGGVTAFGVYKLNQMNTANFTQIRAISQQERDMARAIFLQLMLPSKIHILP